MVYIEFNIDFLKQCIYQQGVSLILSLSLSLSLSHD